MEKKTGMTPISKIVDINKEFTPPDIDFNRQIDSSEGNTSSMFLPDSDENRKLRRKLTTPFFSKTFVSAINSMDRGTIQKMTSRKGIQRMS